MSPAPNTFTDFSNGDELEADAELVYSTEEHIWVATIDWNAIRRVAPATAASAS